MKVGAQAGRQTRVGGIPARLDGPIGRLWCACLRRTWDVSSGWREGGEGRTILCIRYSSVLPILQELSAAEGQWVEESLTS